MRAREFLALPVRMPAWQAPAISTDWEVEAGARVWFSSGTIGAPQPLLDSTGALASRLIFGGLDAASGEVFARLNHRSGFFVKGYLGAGKINNGHLNDEDFPAGADVLEHALKPALGHHRLRDDRRRLFNVYERSAGAKVGPFVGYNY